MQARVHAQVPVICCRYAGKPGLAAKMAAAILAHQDHPSAKAAGVAAALMLERCILGQSIAVRLSPVGGGAPAGAQAWVRHAAPERSLAGLL